MACRGFGDFVFRDLLDVDESAARAAANEDIESACLAVADCVIAMLPPRFAQLLRSIIIFDLVLFPRTVAAAAAVTIATCGTVLLLLTAASAVSSNVPFDLCNRALELLRDVDAKSKMLLHVHAQVVMAMAMAMALAIQL